MKNYICNQDRKKYLIFEADTDEQVDKVASGMLENNTINGLLPFSVMQFDDKIAARVDITSLITVSELLEKCIRRNDVISVIDSVIEIMEETEDYLMDPESVILDCDRMFYDEVNSQLYMCIMPFVNRNTANPELKVFLKNFICRVKFDSTENCEYIGKMLGYLNSESEFSVEDFRYIVNEQKNGIAVVNSIPEESNDEVYMEVSEPEEKEEPVKYTLRKPQSESENSKAEEEPGFKLPLDFYADDFAGNSEQVNLKGIFSKIFKESKTKSKTRKKESDNYDIPVHYCDSNGEIISDGGSIKGTVPLKSENDQKKSFLLRVSNNEKIILKGNKFRIGTEKKSVDYCIKDNCAVSRMHAEIVHKNDSYFIIDNNSTNHTFINEQEIKSKREMKLQNKSRIRLADEEFIFYS